MKTALHVEMRLAQAPSIGHAIKFADGYYIVQSATGEGLGEDWYRCAMVGPYVHREAGVIGQEIACLEFVEEGRKAIDEQVDPDMIHCLAPEARRGELT